AGRPSSPIRWAVRYGPPFLCLVHLSGRRSRAVKYVLFYDGAADMNRAREVFPAHRAKWQEFVARGELLMIGPFSDPRQGAMRVFATREAAEEFVRVDPFLLEGVVKKWELREWREAIAS